MDMMKKMQVSVLKNKTQRNTIDGNPILARYKFNLKTLTVRRMRIREARPRTLYPVDHFDFPQINDNFRFRHYCYVYGVSLRSDKQNLACIRLVKKDLCGGHEDKYVDLPNHYFHEPHFVARPNSSKEDDGILLVLGLDGVKRSSYIAVYDARTMIQINIAWLPTPIPFSLHGNYFPGQQ